MKIIVDSDEYKCWHEAGHAVACLHLGGDVDFIEFLSGHTRGHARTRCDPVPGTEKSVACGGFAAEFYLLNNGRAEQSPDDTRDISRVVFHNATADREEFWGRELGQDETFSVEEEEAFMHHAIDVVVPILDQYSSGMKVLVRELCETKRIDGVRMKELLHPGTLVEDIFLNTN